MTTCLFEHHTENLSVFSLGDAVSYDPHTKDIQPVLASIKSHADILIHTEVSPRLLVWQRLPGKQHRDALRKVVSISKSILQHSCQNIVMSTTPADGVLLLNRSVAVALTSRDCPYLILWAEHSDYIAVLHCGRDQLHNVSHGNVTESVIENALSKMLHYWSASSIRGLITMGISAEHFQNDRYPEITSALTRVWGNEVVPNPDRGTLDLKELILRQLESRGIDRTHIMHDGIDTYSDERCASMRAKRGGHNMVLVNYKPYGAS